MTTTTKENIMTSTRTLPTLTTTPATPSTNPYEGGRMMTTVNCPTCDARVYVAVADVDAIRRGSIVVMHSTNEHWTRVYWGSDPARVQYAPVDEASTLMSNESIAHDEERLALALSDIALHGTTTDWDACETLDIQGRIVWNDDVQVWVLASK